MPLLAYDTLNVASDLASVHTQDIVNGGDLSSSSLLTIDISPTTVFAPGANFQTDPTNPNFVTVPAQLSPTLTHSDQNGVRIGSPSTSVDVANYDNAGTITALAGLATVHRVFMSAIGNVEILYGQTTYADISEASSKLSSDESDIVVPARLSLYVHIGYIISSSTTTVLSDEAQAHLSTTAITDHHHHSNKSSLDRILIAAPADDELLVVESGNYVNKPLPNTSTVKSYTDPVTNGITQADVDTYANIVLTVTTTPNIHVLPAPSNTSKIRRVTVVNSSASIDHIEVNGVSLEQASMLEFTWVSTEWVRDHDKPTYDSIMSTSWLSGGDISINVDPSKFDISAGTGVYVDHFSNPLKTRKHLVTFGPFVGVSLTNILTQPFTRIMIDKDGQIVQLFTVSRENIRDYFALGEVQHNDNATILAFSQFTNIPAVGLGASLYDLASVIGDINIFGNVFSPNGTNLSLNKSVGEVFTLWFAAKNNVKDPSKISHPALTVANFLYTFRNGAGGFNVQGFNTTMVPGSYDDGTISAGPLPNGVVPSNRYTVSRVYLGQANTVIIQYGQALYPTIESAELGISSEPFERNPALDDVLLRGWIITRGNTVDLSNGTNARFLAADKFGTSSSVDAGAGAGMSGWKDNIQDFGAAKGNGTTEPVWANMGNGHYAYLFTPADELFVKFHVTHDYKQGTLAYPHIHFLVNQTMTLGQQITWSFSYVIARGHSQGESLSGPAETTINMVYTATGTEIAGEHIILEVADVDAIDILEPDAILSARIELVSENVAGSIFGLMCDLHYQVDRLATINKAPNFYG